MAPAPPAAAREGATVTSDAILVPNATGLHARPAAVLANIAKSFQSEVKLQLGDRLANARSVTSIMALEVGRGDKVVLVAKGADAKEAVEKLSQLIAQGLGDEGCTPAPAPATTTIAKIAEPPPRPRSDDPNVLVGVAASPGLAVGTVFQVRRAEIVVEEEGRGVEHEQSRSPRRSTKRAASSKPCARSFTPKPIPPRPPSSPRTPSCSTIPIFSRSPTPRSRKARARPSPGKARPSSTPIASPSLRNELLAQRANDVRDVGLRVLELLTGVTRMPPSYPEGSILIAEDLTPSDTATMERRRGGRLRHRARRRDFARRHPRALARNSCHRRHRAARARSRQRHAGHPRWRERFAAPQSAARRDRAHPPAPGAARSAAQGGHRARARAGRDHATASASPSSPTSAGSRTPAGRGVRRRRRRPACARSFSSWIAPPRRAKTNRPRVTPPSCARRAASARHHPHARCRRRQAAALPADPARGQSLPRRARHPRRARPPGSPAHATPRAAPRLAAAASCTSCFR